MIEGGSTGGNVAAYAEAAQWVLAHDDVSRQPDAFRLARRCCGLGFRVMSGEPALIGDWVLYDATRSEAQQQRDVARCVAEWALRERGLVVTVAGLEHIVDALLAHRSRALAVVR